jgi:hypothetical protein
MTDPRPGRRAALAVALLAAAAPVAAQPLVVTAAGDPNAASRIPLAAASGARVHRVYVHLLNPSTDSARDAALQAQVERAFGVPGGATFDVVVADGGLAAVQRVPGVAHAEVRTYRVPETGAVWVAVLVATGAAPPPPPFWSGDLGRHLRFVDTPGAQLKFILNGGFGAFMDVSPWFDKPQAFRAAGYVPSDPTAWPEAYVEPGFGGVANLWGTDAYLYGAWTYLVSSRLAKDVFTTDPTVYGAVEKSYFGVVVGRKGSRRFLDVSAGRRDFELPGDFLVSPIPGSVNAGDRGGSYIGARKAYRDTFSAKYGDGRLQLQAFYLRPDRLPQRDDRSQYAAGVIRWDDREHLEASLTYLAVVRSDARYALPDGGSVPKEGLQTINPRLVLTDPVGLTGTSLAGEYAYQWNGAGEISAQAWYAQAGYRAPLPWTPHLSLRYATFSGDDPRSSTYGRFDPILSGKQDFWLQGMNFGKVQGNTNLRSWRASLRGNPTPSTNLVLDYYHLTADRLNNVGSAVTPAQQLTDERLAHEVMFTASWFATPNLYTSFLTSWTRPMQGLEDALGPGTSPWVTFQLAAYWFF